MTVGTWPLKQPRFGAYGSSPIGWWQIWQKAPPEARRPAQAAGRQMVGGPPAAAWLRRARPTVDHHFWRFAGCALKWVPMVLLGRRGISLPRNHFAPSTSKKIVARHQFGSGIYNRPDPSSSSCCDKIRAQRGFSLRSCAANNIARTVINGANEIRFPPAMVIFDAIK